MRSTARIAWPRARAAAATAAALAATLIPTVAAVPKVCPSNVGLCYTIAVPDSSAQAGKGNIYFQITGPTSLEWAALGTGSGMIGANIFLVYQDGNGNVTISAREGKAHQMPQTESDAAQLTLLAGSGLSADKSTFTANVRCSNCNSWQGGSGTLDFSGTSEPWVGAWKVGGPVNSASTSATITIHDNTIRFPMDMTQTAIQSDPDVNPFVSPSVSGDNPNSSATSGSPGSKATDAASPAAAGGSNSGTVNVDPDKTNPDADGDGDSGSNSATLATAHGIIMILVMAVLYPLGSLMMPVLGRVHGIREKPWAVKPWLIHAGVQLFAFALMWIGFGLGVATATDLGLLTTSAHPRFGIVIVVLFVAQPILGMLHHYRDGLKGRRGVYSYGHMWFGRLLIAMGVVNAGLGLQLAGQGSRYTVPYAIIAALVFITYVGVTAIIHYRNRRDRRRMVAAARMAAAAGTSPNMGPGPGGVGVGTGYAGPGAAGLGTTTSASAGMGGYGAYTGTTSMNPSDNTSNKYYEHSPQAYNDMTGGNGANGGGVGTGVGTGAAGGYTNGMFSGASPNTGNYGNNNNAVGGGGGGFPLQNNTPAGYGAESKPAAAGVTPQSTRGFSVTPRHNYSTSQGNAYGMTDLSNRNGAPNNTFL